MKTQLISITTAALLSAFALQAQAITMPNDSIARAERPEKAEKPEKPEKKEKVGALNSTYDIARAERTEKAEKPEKKEKVGAIESMMQLAREASEGPRGADKERPGDRQRGRG